MGLIFAERFFEHNPLTKCRCEALCWSHARRKFFELTEIAANARRGKTAPPISPTDLEAVRRIDALFAIERNLRPPREGYDDPVLRRFSACTYKRGLTSPG